MPDKRALCGLRFCKGWQAMQTSTKYSLLVFVAFLDIAGNCGRKLWINETDGVTDGVTIIVADTQKP